MPGMAIRIAVSHVRDPARTGDLPGTALDPMTLSDRPPRTVAARRSIGRNRSKARRVLIHRSMRRKGKLYDLG